MALTGYGYMELYPDSVSNVAASPTVSLGTRRLIGGSEYVYVYNAASHTAGIGRGMIQSLMSEFSVTVSSAARGENVCFGVVQNQDMTGNYYGWLMTRGPGAVQLETDTSNAMSDTVTVGEPLFLGTNGGFFVATTGAPGSTYSQGGKVVGVTVSATITSATSGRAYFRCKG